MVYSLVASNSGDVALFGVTYTDDMVSPAFSTNVAMLGSGEVHTTLFTRVVSGDLTNMASVIGYDTNGVGWLASDLAEVDVVSPELELSTTVYGGHDGGLSIPGGELVYATNGAPVTWSYVVSNRGDVAVDNVLLSDTNLVPVLSTNLGLSLIHI